MKKTKVKKWITIILTVWAVGSVIYFIWADNELQKVLGKSTEIVDATSMVTELGTVQIKNVNILYEDCSGFIPNQDVVIKDGKILKISQHQDSLQTTIKTIDGTDKYLIPGLVDSHAHLKESKNDLLLYLVNGVTYIREMKGIPIHLEWKKSLKENGIGPRMFVTSSSITSLSGIGGYFHEWTRKSINYTNESDAHKAISEISEEGYDAIKMYTQVNPEMFKATIKIAKEYNIPVLGHIPEVNLETFYTSGQIEVAHIEELIKKNMERFEKSISKNPEEYLQFLSSNADQIAKKIKENNISVTSTIWLMESLPEQRFDLKSKLKEVELKYANPYIIEGTSLHKLGWLPNENSYEYDGENTPEAKELSLTFWETYVSAIHIMTKALVANNVLIMAGTDTNVSPMVAGFSLHNELESLSKSGLTNQETLYAATVAPNDWMKSNSGKIKVGFNSDLVLLSKNPLEDIKNTKSIDHVFFNKYIIDNAQIKAILKAIEDANNKNRNVEIEEYLN